jgi:dehydrogenase/reductase SDR family member 12
MSTVGGARLAADAALEATVVGSFSRIGISARRALFDWNAEPLTDLSGRVALITGATGGIGLATAYALAARHAEVWIVGRDAARTQHAREQITAAVPEARLSTAIADLGVLDDVHALARLVLRDASRLDVLVHNAGALTHALEFTDDGLEVTAQVHVVAPFLLTNLLLPHLRATVGSRVITVSSGGMYTQPLRLPDLERPGVPFDGARTYANAKRAQVVLNETWPERPEAAGVAFHAMHPGWADTPGIQTALPRFRALMRPLLRTPAEGADTIAWLAGSPDALETNGAFWLDRRHRSTNRLPWTHTSKRTSERLWNWCSERAGCLPTSAR